MYWLTGIAGLILMISPYLFGYANDMTAFWTSLIAGFIVLVASVWEGLETRRANWEYWVAGIVGILAIISPFVLGFSTISSATWATVILGAIIAVLAGSKVLGGGSARMRT